MLVVVTVCTYHQIKSIKTGVRHYVMRHLMLVIIVKKKDRCDMYMVDQMKVCSM